MTLQRRALTAMTEPAARLGGWLRNRRYRGAFRVPAERDDCFVCRSPPQTFPVSLAHDGFDLPVEVVGRGRTAFLVLEAEATALGTLRDPFVEARLGPRECRQYFERGVRGRRHLNLSPLFGDHDAGPRRVVLRGEWMRWAREARLLLFEPPSIADSEILVLAPHPDDAEIAAFGIYAGRRSWVATVTAGERGTPDFRGVLPSGANAAPWTALLRVWDSLAIPQLGDVPRERCVNLVYPDGRLREMQERPDRCVDLACQPHLTRLALRARNASPQFRTGDPSCTWGGLVRELRQLLEATRPGIVVCPHPVLDAHPDHVFATVALEEAARGFPGRLTFLLYAVHSRDAPLYPFGPARAVVSLPPWTEPEWLADSIYSHPLAPDVQRAKYFAIEAVHGDRSFSTAEPKTAAEVVRGVKSEVSAFLTGTGLRPTSFLRRAARPNEIYYVASQESLSLVVTRALARYRS